jgi:hypothetical protein
MMRIKSLANLLSRRERDGGNPRAERGATKLGWRGGKSHDAGARARVELFAKHATFRPAELT